MYKYQSRLLLTSATLIPTRIPTNPASCKFDWVIRLYCSVAWKVNPITAPDKATQVANPNKEAGCYRNSGGINDEQHQMVWSI